ncbi:MAG TPA: class GN sortase [Xanthobacteraceae bacterium]
MSVLPYPPAPTLRRPSRLPTAAAAILALAGAILLGQGAWIHAKALLAQALLESAFAATVATGQSVKPWSWADTWPIARIEVPRLHQSAIVLEGSSWQALAFGPGHVERTPAAGDPGTAVYAAHRDTHFAFLGEVRTGDEILVTRRDGAVLRFRVTGTSVARWDASGIEPDADGRRLVLSTCWPLDGKFSGPLRYLVRAELTGHEKLAGMGNQPSRELGELPLPIGER